MSKSVWKYIGVGLMCILHQHCATSAQIADIRLPTPGPRPDLQFGCAGDMLVPQPERKPKMQASVRAVTKVLAQAKSPYASYVFSTAQDEVMWWLAISGSIDLGTVGTAIHEAGHTVDGALRNCHAGMAIYYLDGKVWTTGLKFIGDTPPLSIARNHIPESIRESRMRYKTYVDTKARNELSVILEEMTAYVGAAELELALTGSPLYKEQFAVADSIDANLGGAADFMLFLTSYLRALRMDVPESWQKVRSNPQLLAFIQHLWTKAEFLLTERQRRHLKTYVVSQDVQALTYSPEFIGELDQLDIQHLPQAPVH